MADMDEPRDPGANPFGMPGDIWSDVPLFREIQRVLSSSTGPVNWELARQVAVASASPSGEDPTPTAEDQRSFDEAVRVAEMHVASFTGLEPPIDLPRVEAVRRARWVEANVEGLKGLLEPAAAKLGEAVAAAQRSAAPEGLPDVASQMLGQISPLLLGAQVGAVLGYLGQHVLGQYDVAVPRPGGAGALMFVVPNISAFERDWSLDRTDFRTWIAVHEVTHRFEFSRSWALPRFREILDDFLSTLQLDIEGLERRLGSIDPTDPDALRSVMEGDESLFGPLLDDEQRLKLRRIQAFMAAAEGYGDHVMHAIGREMLPSYARIDEAMRRYRESETGDPVFERLLGVEMKREQYRLGRRFCDAVVHATDEPTLARMWDSGEAMPSLPELEEPTLWLARTV
jgi:putative hydrolase